MPITFETSPALAFDDANLTTASFTRPPAGGLLVAMLGAACDSAPTVSGGSLTWTRGTQQVSSGVFTEIWTAPVTGSGSITVSATLPGSLVAGGLKVIALTGQHASTPAGASGGGTSTTNNLTVNGYTSTAAGSRGFFAAIELNGLGNPSSSDTGFPWSQNVGGFADVSGIDVHKAANTTVSGTTVAFNADAAGSGGALWTWAALEIMPAVSASARVIVSRAAVHRAASW